MRARTRSGFSAKEWIDNRLPESSNLSEQRSGTGGDAFSPGEHPHLFQTWNSKDNDQAKGEFHEQFVSTH